MNPETLTGLQTLSVLRSDTPRTTYDFKRQCIEHSLYGVDIDPGAVEIAKLRLWLSLVVDEDEIKSIKPLPNLDYKIVCGNSLLGVEKNLFNSRLFSELEKIKPLYFNETNPTKKQEYKRQIDGLISRITNGRKEFDFKTYFSEVFHHKKGFDVVIANPPYIRAEELGDQKIYLKATYAVFTPGGDVFSYFYEKSFNILKNEGVFCFINNAFDKTTAGKTLREYISNNFSLNKYIDFKSVDVFEGTTTYPVILLATKSKRLETFAYLKVTEDLFISFNSGGAIAYTLLPRSALKQSSWSFDHHGYGYAELSEKISNHKKLRDIFGKCYRGIITGINDAFITEKDLRNSKHLKPVFEGKDIKKWLTSAIDKKMIVFENKSTRTCFKGKDEAKAFEAMTAAYPAIMNHLKPFAVAARKRYDKGEYWWELRNCAYYDLFAKPKIIFPNLQNSNKFAYDISGTYLNAPAVFLPTDTKWLLGILNSKVVWYFLKMICVVRSGGFIEVKPQYFEQIPIPALKDTDKKQLDSLVDQILAAKQKTPDADTLVLERQIDQMVYKLYDLTSEEIAMVEGKSD